jgi:glycogen debranching enzyme
MGATVDIPSYEIPVDTKVIRGLPSTLVDLPPVVAVEGSDHDGPYSEIVVPDKFPPGSIMLFATQLQGVDPTLDEFCKSGADEAFKDLNLIDLNVLLFRCDGEERDATGESLRRLFARYSSLH